MKSRPRTKADPIERQIELALRPGGFISDRACFSFVGGLDEVVASIRNVIKTEPARGVALCETFLAGCHGKADELDDSSGSSGQFAQDLICLWRSEERRVGKEGRSRWSPYH